jgi:dephospho-CoA kinase
MSAAGPRKDRAKVIGLAGGIGSGKSEVARILERLGCIVSDSDAQAKAALERPDVKDRLVSWWGSDLLDAEGRVDRRKVASIVFSDPEARRRLEDLVHPLIRAQRVWELERAQTTGAPALVIDAPLLYEAGLDRECDAVIFVSTPRQERLARLAATRGWDEAEVRRRENAQMPAEEKQRRAAYAVNNQGSRADLESQVRDVLAAIISKPTP